MSRKAEPSASSAQAQAIHQGAARVLEAVGFQPGQPSTALQGSVLAAALAVLAVKSPSPTAYLEDVYTKARRGLLALDCADDDEDAP